MDGRAQRGALFGSDGGELQAGDVGVDLHQELVLQQPAGHDEFLDRNTGIAEGVHNGAGSEGRGFQQCPVGVLGLGGQGLAHHHAGKFVVHQHRAVARVPVQGDQAVLADGLLLREFGEVLVDAQALVLGGLVVFGRDAVLGEPAEDVAHSGLACFVTPQAVHDAAVHYSAHARDFAEDVAVHDVAGGGAHDRDELSGFHSVRGRCADVGVHVAHGHGDARWKSGPGRRFVGEVARGVAQAADGVFQLFGHEALELGVERCKEVLGRVLSVLEDAFVSSRAGVADVAAAELPDDPVGSLHPVIHGPVDFRIFFEELQPLGELPFGGDQATVAGKPGLAAFFGELVDAVRLWLGRVVAPQLDEGVRPVREAFQLVQRRAVCRRRNHGARGEVGGDAHYVGRVDTGVGDGGRYSIAQDVAVVVGHLECPIGGKALAGAREFFCHHSVRVFEDSAADLGSVRYTHHDGAAGQGSIVHANDELLVQRDVFRGIHGVSIRLAKASLPGVGVEK